ncbi:MAG: hypothetical protein QOK48_1614 [Blastocatellia bacterium]|nr:hypothetical protein [Blastocatellia bacterium]
MADISYEVPRIPLFVGLANAPATASGCMTSSGKPSADLSKIHAAGSSVAAVYYMPADASSDKSKRGAPPNFTLHNSERIVPGGRSIAGPGSDRPCLIGRMIRQRI